MKMVTPYTLAVEFSRRLRDELTPEQLAEVVAANRAERSPLICHSHDYCDANQIMLDAEEALGLESFPEDETARDEERALVDSAWALAKARGFRP